jgi:hypothetical protein
VVKLVNTRDLKSLGFGFAGSSPAARTKTSASLSGAPDALMIKQLNHHNLRQTDGLSGIDAGSGFVVCKQRGAMNGRDPDILPRTEYLIG